MGATTSAVPPPVMPVAGQPVTNVAPGGVAPAPVVEQRVVTPVGGQGIPLPGGATTGGVGQLPHSIRNVLLPPFTTSASVLFYIPNAAAGLRSCLSPKLLLFSTRVWIRVITPYSERSRRLEPKTSSSSSPTWTSSPTSVQSSSWP
uniref:Uncharacterized protein n=1 Tax=Moniliophthora roreri TaxID=221103 RepID=A0A0W0FPU0_MONRR